jgi:Putative transposase/Transposase zinc-binding domain
MIRQMRLAQVIERYADSLLASYQHRLSPQHLQALAALRRCRTPQSQHMQLQCSSCPNQRFVPHSCGHRLCPHCQHYESQQWLERQLQKHVPAEYFLLTFTLPAELRALAFAHQEQVYEQLLSCSWQTLRQFAENDATLQGTPGAISVLHTHSRRLDYHPHVHIVMPAAALNCRQQLWRTKSTQRNKVSYLFNHKALAKVFRAKFLTALKASGLSLPKRYAKAWIVDCKSVGSGEKALIYLGRYLYRGVIREQDILSTDNGHVRFAYQNSRSKQREIRCLPGADFLWLILQHVLPKGFRRARNFGFLHPNCKRSIALIQLLLQVKPAASVIKSRPSIPCSCCGAPMQIVRVKLTPMSIGLGAIKRAQPEKDRVPIPLAA